VEGMMAKEARRDSAVVGTVAADEEVVVEVARRGAAAA